MDVPVHYWTKDPIQNFRVRVQIRCVQAGSLATGEALDDDEDDFEHDEDLLSGDDGDSEADENKMRNGTRSQDSSSSSSDDDDEDEDLLGRSKDKQKETTKKKKNKRMDIKDPNMPKDGTGRGRGRRRRAGHGQEWSETFTWQEKKFGPRELVRYLGAADDEGANLGRTAIEAEYLEQIARSKRYGEDLMQDVGRVMLFTYTDKDGFVPKNEMTKFVTTSENFSLNPVAESIVTIPGTGQQLEREQENLDAVDGLDDGDYASLERASRPGDVSAGQRVFRESPFKIFYLMAAVDVDTGKLRALRKEDGKFYEVVLCTVKVSREGNLVQMQPGFSKGRFLNTGGSGEQGYGGSSEGQGGQYQDHYHHINKNDKQESRQSHGSGGSNGSDACKWYRFKTPFGSIYEYSLVNEAESSDPLLETEINTVQRENLEKAAAALEGRVPMVLYDGPNKPGQVIKRVNIEIVSAFDFEEAASDHLYIQYEVHLPVNGRTMWTWADGSREPMRGVTQTARARYLTQFQGFASNSGSSNDWRSPGQVSRRHTAHYCFPLELVLIQTVQDEIDSLSHEQPKIYLQVKSRDGWERHRTEGYASLGLPGTAGTFEEYVRAWRVAGSLRQQLAEHFVGGALQLDSSMYSSIPQTHQGPFLNRYGFCTRSAGCLRLRLHTVLHHYVSSSETTALDARDKQMKRLPMQSDFMADGSSNVRGAGTQQGGARRRTVTEILQSLRLGKSLGQGLSVGARTGTRAGAGAANILASLDRVHQQNMH